MSNNSKRLGFHILFLLLYSVYEIVNAAWTSNGDFDFSQIHKVLVTLPFIICAIYINLYVLMPRYLYPKLYGRYIVSILVLALVWALLMRFIGYQFWLPWDEKNWPGQYQHEPKHFFVAARIGRNVFRLYPVLALTTLIKVLRNSYTEEKQLRLLEVERHKAEILNLRSQIHPHFFFNTLSGLYSLTLKKSDEAPNLVLKLSGLMHYVLYETNSDRVLLADELKHLCDYMAIEQLRFGDRVDLSFQTSGNIEGKRIIPLLLLPFIENAFKHNGCSDSDVSWITIVLKVSDHLLFLAVENSFSPLEIPVTGKGIGLMNVRRRLELGYPGRHSLFIENDDKIFKIQLSIDLSEKN